MKTSTCYLLVLVFTCISCAIEPEAINYNYDECAYCKMKISDVRFGAELVTSKGKVYKYDSAECLVNTYIEKSDEQYAFVLVTDYSRPHHLVDAQSAHFLISEKIPSPMGGNLSSYEYPQIANQFLDKNGGDLFSFQELVSVYKKKSN